MSAKSIKIIPISTLERVYPTFRENLLALQCQPRSHETENVRAYLVAKYTRRFLARRPTSIRPRIGHSIRGHLQRLAQRDERGIVNGFGT